MYSLKKNSMFIYFYTDMCILDALYLPLAFFPLINRHILEFFSYQCIKLDSTLIYSFGLWIIEQCGYTII